MNEKFLGPEEEWVTDEDLDMNWGKEKKTEEKTEEEDLELKWPAKEKGSEEEKEAA